MLEDLVAIHLEVMANTPRTNHRYLYNQLNWDSKGICIIGDRGVGKTTMICQYLLEKYKSVERALYVSADNLNVTSLGLFKIAKQFFSLGGEALFIDEIHKYPNWSIELKNIIDTYKKQQIVFSASSALDLKKSKGDLSRRVVYHHLLGLSFREYLNLTQNKEIPVYSLSTILKDHVTIASQMKSTSVLKLFREYLSHGFYPFFLEGLNDYLAKLNNVVEKVLFEDVAVVYNLKQTTLPILKKLIWLVATSDGLIPNIDRISKNLGVTRVVVYNCLEYLSNSGLLMNLYSNGRGMKLIRKPQKIFINNTNLLHAINGTLQFESQTGGIRETFFANQVGSFHKVNTHDKGDFLVDDKIIIEVGGPGKNGKQIKGIEDAFLAIDDIEVGFGKKIPLYLFGLLY